MALPHFLRMTWSVTLGGHSPEAALWRTTCYAIRVGGLTGWQRGRRGRAGRTEEALTLFESAEPWLYWAVTLCRCCCPRNGRGRRISGRHARAEEPHSRFALLVMGEMDGRGKQTMHHSQHEKSNTAREKMAQTRARGMAAFN